MNEEIFKKVTAVIVDKLGVKAEDVKPESEFGNDPPKAKASAL